MIAFSNDAQTGNENPNICLNRNDANAKLNEPYNFQPQSKDDSL
jgi:hypothetical protein